MKKYQDFCKQVAPLINDIETRGYLEYRDLIKIGAFKSAQIVASLSVNKPDEIEKVTAEAIRHAKNNEDEKAICELKKLDGCGIRMISAILAILYPKKYGMIDRWAYKAWKGKCVQFPTTWEHQKKEYLEYLDYIRREAKNKNDTPRSIDIKLLKKGKELRDCY